MIYADNAATTRISERAFEQMLPFLREQYGNASSQYSLGARAKRAVEHSRKQVARAIGAEPAEITFTSGGSETNSWVLGSMADIYRTETVHVITSAIEHNSVLNACRALERKDVEMTFLPVDAMGLISVDLLKAAIRPNTKLVSIMLANNEVGTIQPISEMGQFLKERGILLHTDAVQAVGHIPVDVNDLHVDFLTASAHKFNGAKGVGILYKRLGRELQPLVFGGEQERGLRSGTENVAGIVSAGYAIEESVSEMDDTAKRLRAMVEATVKGVKERILSLRVNGDTANRLPGLVNLGFDGVSGESLMHLLDLKGICVSTSSACSSGKTETSHVLRALGLREPQAKSAIRISYGKSNTVGEANAVVAAICDSYARLANARS